MPNSEDARARREALVRGIARRSAPWPGRAWDPGVLQAMRDVPRHVFAPELDLESAYADIPQGIGHGQTISQPTVVALMTQALELSPTTRVLEIGTGSGYQAAVLSRLAKHVYSIEVVPALARSARQHLASLGITNVEVREGDGYAGWPEAAPFDRIVLTAAPEKIPEPLFEQLADGGLLVAPVGPEHALQRLLRARKSGGLVRYDDLGGVMFVPMTGIAQRPAW
ncbi:MAG: protein-L-isoaspartate(D-aspartate) O-methyltransferase [Polyangiaceae bacterium]